MEKASGLRSLPLLAEGRHRPLTGCPLGPPWGAVFGLVLVPGRVPGLKPRSSLRLGSQCFVQAFCRGDTWHLRLWVLPVLSAFNFTFLLSFSFFFFFLFGFKSQSRGPGSVPAPPPILPVPRSLDCTMERKGLKEESPPLPPEVSKGFNGVA